jgi:hypothetical protein
MALELDETRDHSGKYLAPLLQPSSYDNIYSYSVPVYVQGWMGDGNKSTHHSGLIEPVTGLSIDFTYSEDEEEGAALGRPVDTNVISPDSSSFRWGLYEGETLAGRVN